MTPTNDIQAQNDAIRITRLEERNATTTQELAAAKDECRQLRAELADAQAAWDNLQHHKRDQTPDGFDCKWHDRFVDADAALARLQNSRDELAIQREAVIDGLVAALREAQQSLSCIAMPHGDDHWSCALRAVDAALAAAQVPGAPGQSEPSKGVREPSDAVAESAPPPAPAAEGSDDDVFGPSGILNCQPLPGPVAQPVERQPDTLEVAGSMPAGTTPPKCGCDSYIHRNHGPCKGEPMYTVERNGKTIDVCGSCIFSDDRNERPYATPPPVREPHLCHMTRGAWACLWLSEDQHYIVPNGPPCATQDSAWRQHESALGPSDAGRVAELERERDEHCRRDVQSIGEVLRLRAEAAALRGALTAAHARLQELATCVMDVALLERCARTLAAPSDARKDGQ